MRNRVLYTLFLVIIVCIFAVPVYGLLQLKADRWHREHYGVPAGVQLNGHDIGGYYPEEVRAYLLNEAVRMNGWPLTASIDRDGMITSAVWGRILDLDATMERVRKAQPGQKITPVFGVIKPTMTEGEIVAIDRLLGVFFTMVGGTEDRLHNIRVGAKLINYTLLMPGEIFSFVQTVGEPTQERGFREAPVIIGEDFVPGYGGGICQISTTLYNAVLKAKLKVLERYPHSQKVRYVAPGMDAAVAYDYLDFKFQNILPYPVMIRSWVWGRRLQIGIYGQDL